MKRLIALYDRQKELVGIFNQTLTVKPLPPNAPPVSPEVPILVFHRSRFFLVNPQSVDMKVTGEAAVAAYYECDEPVMLESPF
jgi:hypothetical protein